MPREITSHKVNDCNASITVTADDEPGCGGTNHVYCMAFVTKRDTDGSILSAEDVWLRFQNGPIKETGVNGVTHEALLAVLIDRLEGFQRGPFATALIHLRNAIDALGRRTIDRMNRGVEGTHTV